MLGRLNRARVAERLGDRDQAAGLYQYVVDAWRHADPELRPHVGSGAGRSRAAGGGAEKVRPRALSRGPQCGSPPAE